MAGSTSTFEYSIRDKSGKIVKGTLDAESPAMVAQRLRGMGYAPVSIAKKSVGMKSEIKIPGFSGKVKLKELAIMSRQFSTMINAGLSLLRALTILEQQTPNSTLRESLASIRNDVEAGQSLSQAMAKFNKIYPPIMINMVRAGEVGGFLDEVLLQVAGSLEADVRLRGKIKSAMTYPVVVFCIAILAVVGMLIFVVPTFANMFATLGGELPAPTRVLVTMSELMKYVGPLLVVGVVVGLVVWRKIRYEDRTREIVDPLRLRLPVFGKLMQKISISRFSRNLGTMVHAGVPILQALDIVADTSGNIVVAKAVRAVQESVRSGESLSGPLANHPVFPPMVVQMMAVGEDTGAIDDMLNKIAEFYDQEVEATTEALTSLIEPLMIVVLGAVIGGMIVALYLPIFNVFELIK